MNRLSNLSPFQLGIAALIISLCAIIGAWSFELVGGYIPCALCLEQREPYYFGLPFLIFSLVMLHRHNSRLASGFLAVFGLAMFYSFLVAVYQSGAEWHFWEGPVDCAGATKLTESAGSLLADISAVQIVSCKEAAGRFLGISFAGWNAVATLIAAGLAFTAARNNLAK